MNINGAHSRPLPPLNPLKAFEATGRSLSVTRAADELSVTPAAVSRQIKALEDYLSVQLFRRMPTGLELTAAGERYLADIVPLFNALRESTNAIVGGSTRRQLLKIRAPATFAVRWLIPRLAGFHIAHPAIDVQLTTSPAALDFEHEDLDGGIQLGGGDWPGIGTQMLTRNELVPVVSASFASDLRAPEELVDQVLLHSLARLDDWALWLREAGVPQVNPYRGMRYETSLLAYQAAIEGHGVAIAQKSLVSKELEAGLLRMPFDLVIDRQSFSYYFAWPVNKTESTALSTFREWLSQRAE
ncbi:LysR substrate-binding domain-containing protein [Pseudomonas sp. NPDC088368]|uniref:LysR substrate-binding domain-containing protein n=1 Tax=Pseudomonas sp. NPDC088368 TaxID=3364453 RepID=UPI0037F8C72E